MESCEEGNAPESEPVQRTQPLCRFFSQGRHCSFGNRCKFLHVRDDAGAHEKKANRTPSQPDVHQDPGGSVGHRPPHPNKSRAGPPAAGRRPCRYFLSGHCTMEDRCRFWHPPQLPSVDGLPVSDDQMRPAQRMIPVPRPAILQEVKLCDLTEDVAEQLRETEIKQLKKRFPKDKLIIQERSDGKVTFYRMTVEATDPDWVHSFFFLLPLLFHDLRAMLFM